MRRLTLPLVLIAVAALALAFRYAPERNLPSPEGVWKSVEVTITNEEGATTNEVTQPNLTIFTKGHYASLRVAGGPEPRELLPEDPSDEQLLAAFRRFRANAGTYEVSGSEITTKVILHMNPNATAEQRTNTAPFEVEGDVMFRTFTNAAGTTFRVKYERVE